jgi:hypothetical protein
MILANVRTRLRPADFRLVVGVLSRGNPGRRDALERLLADEGPDRLLDEPGLLEALLAARSLVVPSPPLFAYVAVRHTLRAAGIDSRDVADYLAALVLAFGDHARYARIRARDDATYHYLVDIVSAIAAGEESGERAYLLLTHLGNYSLWLAGLFPDYIAARRLTAGGPDLPYYDALGRQGYHLASRHQLAGRYGVAGIYRVVADSFPVLRQAFNRLSDRVFFPNVFTSDKVIRNL